MRHPPPRYYIKLRYCKSTETANRIASPGEYPVLMARQEYRRGTWLNAVCETSIAAARSRLRVAGSGGTAVTF